ncbi:MAG: hypothetical protein JSV55_04315 [Deltaproteobacteria bacterium]|nr:MAG: hypothetical protein JSV40_04130 [Deltaproteobacteria bacterium]UCH08216.1 MAG: hypothetical protein JSV55_04315 [Deltaproteobacteria bacterium]
MSEENVKDTDQLKTSTSGELAGKLAAVSWSLFFIWIGIILLMKIGTGIGLLGVGVITLGAQVARKYFNLKLEPFWVVVGLLFVLGGLWGLFDAKLPLVPIVFIAAGLALLVSTIRGKHLMRK